MCTQTFNTPIVPVVLVIDDSGYSIADLPPGINEEFVNDTLTLTGTPSAYGYSTYVITSTSGCTFIGVIVVGEETDPGVTCAADGESISLSWDPWVTAPLSQGNIFISWSYPEGSGSTLIIPPAPSTFTIQGIPPGTDVLVTWWILSGYPQCSGSIYHLTCTTTTTLGIEDHDQAAFTLSPNPVGQFMRIIGKPIDRIRIHDHLGHEVGIELAELRSGQVDVSSLAPGVYTAQISSSGRMNVLRFIKE